MKESKIPHSIYVVKDGQEALDFLYINNRDDKDSYIPDLVLLDLILPIN